MVFVVCFSLPFYFAAHHYNPYIFSTRFILSFSLFFLFAGTCLRDLKIYVPEAVAVGDAVTLSCHYNLENVSIRTVYRMKMYRSDTTSETHNYPLLSPFTVMCLQGKLTHTRERKKIIATNKIDCAYYSKHIDTTAIMCTEYGGGRGERERAHKQQMC